MSINNISIYIFLSCIVILLVHITTKKQLFERFSNSVGSLKIPGNLHIDGELTIGNNSAFTKISKEFFNILYPIGSVVIRQNEWKGYVGQTWEKTATGKVLIGSGKYKETGFEKDYKPGDTGGKAKVKLSVAELPPHSHRHLDRNWSPAGGGGHGPYRHPFHHPQDPWRNTKQTGSGQAHENMPPYEVVVFYKRVL